MGVKGIYTCKACKVIPTCPGLAATTCCWPKTTRGASALWAGFDNAATFCTFCAPLTVFIFTTWTPAGKTPPPLFTTACCCWIWEAAGLNTWLLVAAPLAPNTCCCCAGWAAFAGIIIWGGCCCPATLWWDCGMTSPDIVVIVGNDPLTTVPLGKLLPPNCCWPPAKPINELQQMLVNTQQVFENNYHGWQMSRLCR